MYVCVVRNWSIVTKVYFVPTCTSFLGRCGASERKLIEGVCVQLVEAKTRPLLQQMQEDGVSEDKLVELEEQINVIK